MRSLSRYRSATLVLAALALLALPAPTFAQWLRPSDSSAISDLGAPALQHEASATAQSGVGSVLVTTGGALLGGTIGGLGGGLIGGAITSNDCDPGDPDRCLGMAFPGIIWGFGIGTTLGTPLGAHLANRTRGDFPLSLLASSAIFAAEVLALNLLVEDGRTQHQRATLVVVTATPILQLLSSVYIEQSTSRSR